MSSGLGQPSSQSQGGEIDEVARALKREARETSNEVGVAVAIVIAMQLALAIVSLDHGWTLFHVRGWIWWVPILPELILVGVLFAGRTREPAAAASEGERRKVGIALLVVIAAWNAVTVVLLILELFTGEVRTGGELMMEGTVVLATLVLNFGLLFWEIDGGGARARALDPKGPRDFLFSEMGEDGQTYLPAEEKPGGVRPWYPRLLDYTYLAFVTAIAWSAADTLPLSRRAKVLMAVETGIAALTILLVAARAISIFG